jgi:hypothetical protein
MDEDYTKLPEQALCVQLKSIKLSSDIIVGSKKFEDADEQLAVVILPPEEDVKFYAKFFVLEVSLDYIH